VYYCFDLADQLLNVEMLLSMQFEWLKVLMPSGYGIQAVGTLFGALIEVPYGRRKTKGGKDLKSSNRKPLVCPIRT
jgi:hypothetical protein